MLGEKAGKASSPKVEPQAGVITWRASPRIRGTGKRFSHVLSLPGFERNSLTKVKERGEVSGRGK